MVDVGRLFVHSWCLQFGHYDNWQSVNGLKLKDTDAPLFEDVNADDIKW